MQILPHYVQFPDSSWIKVLQSWKKTFFLRSKVLKKVPWFEFLSLILAENPCFSLISLTGKSVQILPDFPDRWKPCQGKIEDPGTKVLTLFYFQFSPKVPFTWIKSERESWKGKLLVELFFLCLFWCVQLLEVICFEFLHVRNKIKYQRKFVLFGFAWCEGVWKLPLEIEHPCWPPRGQLVWKQRQIWGIHTGDNAQKEFTLVWNPGQTSPEVQNRGINGPTKKDLCPAKIFLKKKRTHVLHIFF